MLYLGVELTDQLTVKTARDLKKCTSAVQDYVLQQLNEVIGEKLLRSISVLHQDYVGTLTRCISHLESNTDDEEMSASASKALQDVIYHQYTL